MPTIDDGSRRVGPTPDTTSASPADGDDKKVADDKQPKMQRADAQLPEKQVTDAARAIPLRAR